MRADEDRKQRNNDERTDSKCQQKGLQPLAPPGEPDQTEMGVRTCRDDIGEREIQIPQCRKCRPQPTRQLLERNPIDVYVMNTGSVGGKAGFLRGRPHPVNPVVRRTVRG